MKLTTLSRVALTAAQGMALASCKGIDGRTGHVLTPVFDTDGLDGADLLPTTRIINQPLVNLDGTARPAKGHFVTAVDSDSFNIYPPVQGCGYGVTTTSAEARYRGCSVAMNVGFFDIANETNPHCLGGVVSDKVLLQNDATDDVHFGLTSDRRWFVGYVDDGFLKRHTLDTLTDRCIEGGPCETDDDVPWYFRSLSSGRFQLVNEGRSYVNESSTGSDGDVDFTTAVSGRTALGVLGDGRLGMVQIDGKTGSEGMDLYTLADMMIDLGFVQAINVDGGGSSTTAINGVLASLPSDACPDDDTGLLGCERPVTTIACLHVNPQRFVTGFNEK